MANTSRPALASVTMSSFAQSQGATTQAQNMMVGLKAKTVTDSGSYNGQQSGAATSDVVSVGADYGIWDYTASIALDSNSTNLKDPI